MPGHSRSSRSIKSDPLGLIDTRMLTAADPSIAGLFCPSFASLIALDGASHTEPPVDMQGLREKPYKTSNRREIATDEVPRGAFPFHALKSGRQYPKLELDVAVDRFHGLDSFAVPLNPQNTPASRSEQGGSHEMWPCCDTENLRIGSAPQAQPLTLDWPEDEPGKTDACETGDKDADWWCEKQERRSSAADEPSFVAPPTLTWRNVQEAGNASPTQEPQSPSSAKRVRFPPSSGSPQIPPCSIHRPVPSVERKQNYVSSYRQKKQYVKWKGAIRCHRRVFPHRSPVKALSPLVNRLNRRPEIRFSPLSSLPFCKTDPIRFVTQTNTAHGAVANAGLQEPKTITANGEILAHEDCNPQEKIDLVAVTLSTHKAAYLSQPSPPNQQAYTFQVQVHPIVIQRGVSTPPQNEKKQVVCRSNVGGLVLHICLIMPALVLEIPLAIVLFAERTVPSRMRVVIIEWARALLSSVMTFFLYVLSKFGLNLGLRVQVIPATQTEDSSFCE